MDTSVEQQLERTSKDKNRPLLNSANPQDVLEKLMLVRDPIYTQTSDLIVKTDRRHPRGVVTEIVKQLARQGIIAGD